MQLNFSSDEYAILAEALAHRDREFREEITRTDNRDFRRALRLRQEALDELENKIVRKDVDFQAGELDLLAEVIDHCDRELTTEIIRTDRRDFRDTLRRRAELLGHVRDKVFGARAVA